MVCRSLSASTARTIRKYAIRIDKSLRGNDSNWLGERYGG